MGQGPAEHGMHQGGSLDPKEREAGGRLPSLQPRPGRPRACS